MSISNGNLYKNGKRFIVRGMSLEGGETPRWCTTYRWGFQARNHYGRDELKAYIHRWNANTIRLQVSQPGLTSHSSAARSAYLNEVKREVATARRLGLVVIVSVDDQARACGKTHPLPNAATVRAWKKLSARFRNDPHVMFELFNEPEAGGSKAQWNQWANGGSWPLGNEGTTAVGMRGLVHDIRGWGASNVILVDGGDWAEHLNGTTRYPITDTGSGRGIGYAVHPYRFNEYGGATADRAEWQSAYGFVTKSRLVVVTEWSYSAKKCSSNAPSVTPKFLSYLHNHGIGMTAFAGDVLHHTVANWNYDPTNCHGGRIGGNGKQTMHWMRTGNAH